LFVNFLSLRFSLTSDQIWNVLQHDAAISAGSSGGVLLDKNGEMIGMNTAIVLNAENIGFAIPISIVFDVCTQILHYGSVTRVYFGAKLLPTQFMRFFALGGVMISGKKKNKIIQSKINIVT
jgi:serine protease Do